MSVISVQRGKIYGLQFWLLCLSTFLFFSSFNMIIPELPAYLTSLGGAEYKGLIISLFTVTAAISRPFSGKLADTIGRLPVMIFGSLVCVVCGVVYPIFATIWGLFLIRLVHGFSTGFQPTGIAAYVSDIIPKERRGEAMGYLGFFVSLGFAVGQWFGPRLAGWTSVEIMFYASSIFALLSVLVVIGMKETVAQPQRFQWSLLKVKFSDVYEPKVFSPSLVMMLTGVSFGTILTIIPDFSDYLQTSSRGDFFAVFTVAALFVRLVAGKASDKFGRVAVLKVAVLGIALSMFLLGFSSTHLFFFSVAVLFGLTSGISSPTIFAWTIDLSDEQHRGRGMATMYIALEIGIGCGALLSAALYNNDHTRFILAFSAAGVMATLALIYVLLIPSDWPK